jgi:hypothetical protein
MPGVARTEDVTSSAAPAPDKPATPPTGLDAIRALQQQMMDMQRQLAQLATGSYTPSADKSKDS